MKPHDHIGWVFTGPDGFAALAEPFLAEGAARNERLMYVCADPGADVAARLDDRLGPGVVRVASIAEVYGPSGVVDAAAQHATFATALAQAQADGYSGIRVAADNTPLVADEERLAAWLRWEVVADRFMSEHPVTGLCAFDREQADVDRLRHLATFHPLSSAGSPAPQYRMFAEAGHLRIEGQIDSFAIGQLQLALDVLPPDTGVLIDLATAGFTSRVPQTRLRRLADAGVTVTLRGLPAGPGGLPAAEVPLGEQLLLQRPAPG
ncbi:MEDS domain-containing protein [Actinomadura sp. ATCC 31491]|uniref:MEDS domain-containing protein n=1 Tax=Actinomadura luzonensis TaxID=2805427 RepID=A0ABT0G256_9ACTN|nr:MEDS domain-containing protein [Actinomadura luzonensis]MCK2218687.1 MEDS domain-containing protein [Actinomadura luzonensis]